MEKRFKRIILVILDGVGIGELPDADFYGDQGSNTLLHVHEKTNLELPNMSALGLSCLLPLKTKAVNGAYGIMAEKSKGKDTTTGHWELAGIVLDKAFPTYPKGFPPEVIDTFCKKIGRDILANYPASGTEIINKLGDEHVKTGKPIVYTSADSVFQIAAHEDVISVPELYKMCEIAREILSGEHAVGRVIARPFIGSNGDYSRTKNRHDYSLNPVEETVLDLLKNKGYSSIGVGKIGDIFAGQGITESFPVKGNPDCFAKTLDLIENKKDLEGLIFTNLVDFDMLYGHRNNPQGFKECLNWFDDNLPKITKAMTDTDLLILTADHGNDPTTPSTDHSREYVPLLVYYNGIKLVELGKRDSFADIAKTISHNFGLNNLKNGKSFLNEIQFQLQKCKSLILKELVE